MNGGMRAHRGYSSGEWRLGSLESSGGEKEEEAGVKIKLFTIRHKRHHSFSAQRLFTS